MEDKVSHGVVGEAGRPHSDDELDVGMIAFMNDEPHDTIDNAIGLLDSSVEGKPIPYEPNPAILR